MIEPVYSTIYIKCMEYAWCADAKYFQRYSLTRVHLGNENMLVVGLVYH